MNFKKSEKIKVESSQIHEFFQIFWSFNGGSMGEFDLKILIDYNMVNWEEMG